MIRRCIANALRRAAARLDGEVPAVTTMPGGGYEISLHGLPLARVSPGQIQTTRDTT